MDNKNKYQPVKFVVMPDSVYMIAEKRDNKIILVDVLEKLKYRVDRKADIKGYEKELAQIMPKFLDALVKNCPKYSEELMQKLDISSHFNDWIIPNMPRFAEVYGRIIPCNEYKDETTVEEVKNALFTDAERWRKSVNISIKWLKESYEDVLEYFENPPIIRRKKDKLKHEEFLAKHKTYLAKLKEYEGTFEVIEKYEEKLKPIIELFDEVYAPYIQNVSKLHNHVRRLEGRIRGLDLYDDEHDKDFKPFTSEIFEFCEQNNLCIMPHDLVDAVIEYHKLNNKNPDDMINLLWTYFKNNFNADVEYHNRVYKQQKSAQSNNYPHYE